jgi:hypothetical protein
VISFCSTKERVGLQIDSLSAIVMLPSMASLSRVETGIYTGSKQREVKKIIHVHIAALPSTRKFGALWAALRSLLLKRMIFGHLLCSHLHFVYMSAQLSHHMTAKTHLAMQLCAREVKDASVARGYIIGS